MNLSITFTFRESDCDSRRTSDKNFKHTKFPGNLEELDSSGFLRCQKTLDPCSVEQIESDKIFHKLLQKGEITMLMRKGRSKVEKVQYTVTASTIPMAVNFGLVRVLRLLLVHVSRSRQTFLPIFCHFLSQPKDRLRYAMSSKCHDLRL